MQFPSKTAILLAATVFAASSACSSPPEEEEAEASGGELSSLERSGGFYHWSEGGDLYPLFALKALRVKVDGQEVPFLSSKSLARFGLSPDPKSETNPEGLPVGMTLGRAADTGLVSVGFNCAACHTADIAIETSNGRRLVRVDGAPGQFDFMGFNTALLQAFNTAVGPNADLWDTTEFAARATAEAWRVSRAFEDFDGGGDSAWVRFKMFLTVAQAAVDIVPGDIESIVARFDVPERRKRLLVARYYSMASHEKSSNAARWRYRATRAEPIPSRAVRTTSLAPSDTTTLRSRRCGPNRSLR